MTSVVENRCETLLRDILDLHEEASRTTEHTRIRRKGVFLKPGGELLPDTMLSRYRPYFEKGDSTKCGMVA
jgi:hypothetical protein